MAAEQMLEALERYGGLNISKVCWLGCCLRFVSAVILAKAKGGK